jgi:NADPH:quinone reductase-like Zn-dependent oxidoreductase
MDGCFVLSIIKSLFQTVQLLPHPTPTNHHPSPHRAGYHVLTTASPHNHALLLSLGADEAFDYSSPTCAANILASLPSRVEGVPYIFDTISTPAATALCEQVIAHGGRYGAILKARIEREDVINSFNLAYTVLGEKVDKYGWVVEQEDTKDDFEWAKGWAGVVEGLLREGRLKAHPARVGEGGKEGLEGVLDGIVALREGRVSGVKLVYVV